MSLPSWVGDIPAGADFVSMSLQYKMYCDNITSPAYLKLYVRDNSVDVKTIDRTTLSDSTVTDSGDASYWGFTGTASEILTKIVDGTIRFLVQAGSPSTYEKYYFSTFGVSVTYTSPDTTRASVIAVIP